MRYSQEKNSNNWDIMHDPVSGSFYKKLDAITLAHVDLYQDDNTTYTHMRRHLLQHMKMGVALALNSKKYVV